MIFVTVGTVQFDDLIRKIDEIAKKSKEEFIVQIGEGKYIPKNCKWLRFKVPLTEYFKNSKLVIMHGGAGTLFECLNIGIRIIAVPNLKAKAAHQLDLVYELAKAGYIVACDLNGLEKAIKEKKKLKKYVKVECKIGNVIENFLNETSL
jgi:beta-1,4-N-acetylglucosaminyltransferase